MNQLVALCPFSEEELLHREEQLQRLGEELLQKEEWLGQVKEELHVKEDEGYKKNEEVIISNCSNVLNNIRLSAVTPVCVCVYRSTAGRGQSLSTCLQLV